MSDLAEAPCWPNYCSGDEQNRHIVSTLGNCGSGESTLSQQLDSKTVHRFGFQLYILLGKDMF